MKTGLKIAVAILAIVAMAAKITADESTTVAAEEEPAEPTPVPTSPAPKEEATSSTPEPEKERTPAPKPETTPPPEPSTVTVPTTSTENPTPGKTEKPTTANPAPGPSTSSTTPNVTSATIPTTITTTTTTTTTTKASTASSPTPSSTKAPAPLPEGETNGPTNVTCVNTKIYARVNDAVNVTCTVFINKMFMEWSEWTLDFYFRQARFRPNASEMEAAKIAGFGGLGDAAKSYPARIELVFSLIRDSKNNTWIAGEDTSGKYSLSLLSSANKFILTVKNVSMEDHGKFEIVLKDRMHLPMVQRNVSLAVYKSPERLDLTAVSVPAGSRYEASCTITNFFPPRSVSIDWMVNGKSWKRFRRREATLMSFWWLEYPKGATLVSTLRLWRAKNGAPPPKFECFATWRVMDVSKKRNGTVTPIMYHKPDMSVRFEGGFAICDIVCTPPNIPVMWLINDNDQPASSVETVVTDRCKTDVSLVNVKSRINVADAWEKSTYTCRMKNYPPEGHPFEASRLYDATPVSRGKPIIAIIVVVFGIALVLGLIILAVALCFYRSSNSVKYRRL